MKNSKKKGCKRVVLGEGRAEYMKRFIDNQQLIGLLDEKRNPVPLRYTADGLWVRLVAELKATPMRRPKTGGRK